MGDRANYAIRENGQVELFYSHWGALTVAEDVFWGPAQTETFIRRNERTSDWLDDVWAQGGIALDKDMRRLTYYYFVWLDEDDLRRVYESLLEETWQAAGWSTRRALTWQEFAAALGVDAESVTATPTPPLPITFGELGKNLACSFCCGIMSVRTDQAWRDFAIDFSLPGILMNGPPLIDRLSTVADLEALRAAFHLRPADDSAKTVGDWIHEYCRIDIPARSLRISLLEHEEDCLSFVQGAWPGWQVLIERGGAEEHFAHTGREVPSDLVPSPKPPPADAPNRPYAECVRLIWKHLDGTDARKSAAIASHLKLIQTLTKNRGPATMAPGFLTRVPSSQPGLFDRLRTAFRLRKRQPR